MKPTAHGKHKTLPMNICILNTHGIESRLKISNMLPRELTCRNPSIRVRGTPRSSLLAVVGYLLIRLVISKVSVYSDALMASNTKSLWLICPENVLVVLDF